MTEIICDLFSLHVDLIINGLSIVKNVQEVEKLKSARQNLSFKVSMETTFLGSN
jgi:hypothetical protein